MIDMLPPESPLEMPRRSVQEPPLPPRFEPGTLAERLARGGTRLLLLAGTASLTAYGVREMYGVLTVVELTGLQAVFLGLFAVNFLWVSFAACNVVLGFLRRRLGLGRRSDDDAPAPLRTAVLVPVYDEEPSRPAAAIRVMARGLCELAPERFAFFVLSDSRDPDGWIHEEDSWRRLVVDADPRCPVHYRHRRENTERKAGNIADWVMRWGGAWDAMVVLDADSLMAPDTLVRLSRRLAADPGLGLIQTLPTIFGANTLFGRLQQFANCCFGPLFGEGLASWHGRAGNFWGHNAILRTRAFADAGRLPVLSGSPPFGGSVMSHDFVEAALLRRRGWGVRFDADLPGSHEEAPPSLPDLMVRDRRWCQGNLQHLSFLFARGLSPLSRLHMLTGIMAYVSVVMWFALVLTGLLLGVQAALTRPEYFATPGLFPSWPVFDSARALDLFVVSMGVVLLPKMLGWLDVMCSPSRLRSFGGPLALTGSVLVETALSLLYAPIMMLAQTRVVLQVLRGAAADWLPQRRSDGGIRAADAWRLHRGHVVTGVAISALAWSLDLRMLLWLLPVTIGPMLAPGLSWLSGRRGPARALSALALLRTPGEKRERALFDALEAELAEHPAPPRAGALQRLSEDAELREWHLAGLRRAPHADDFDPALELARAKASREPDPLRLQAFLEAAEARAFLGDAALVAALATPRDEASVSAVNG